MFSNDQQLIDMNCYFGNPFPLLNKDGSEVLESSLSEGGLIKVVLKEHQGKESTAPFQVFNKQMVE